ncbi:MAG: EamA family transporter [Acidobacteria bacterium]|nr:EamA family transporter [Acidobacteriota bacterium]
MATTPFWMVGMEALLGGGEPIHGPTFVGLLVRFGGCALLVGPELWRAGFQSGYWKGFLALQVGSLGWSYGSIYNRNRPRQAHPIVGGAFQQLGAGLVCAPIALLATHAPITWTTRSFGGFLYLVIFGSILGFSAYLYALEHLPGFDCVTLFLRQPGGRGVVGLAGLPRGVRAAGGGRHGRDFSRRGAGEDASRQTRLDHAEDLEVKALGR